MQYDKEAEADILDTLRSSRRAWTVAAIAEDTGRADTEIAEVIGRLVETDLAYRLPRGGYRLRSDQGRGPLTRHLARRPGTTWCGRSTAGLREPPEGAPPCAVCARHMRTGGDAARRRDIGSGVRALRISLGASVSRVAEVAGLQGATVLNVEAGCASWATLDKVLGALRELLEDARAEVQS